ncbi:MAG: formylmethanofuran dehydrogenase subunit B, partial [Gemmatimonadetes bacterium]|nr:formylmethanofuran dehydrogenase subunit B [Gemmatimonadota bacterium]
MAHLTLSRGASEATPAALVDGRPATLEAAAGAAAALLLRAAFPLVHGLGRATVEAQRRAVEIADLLGAVIDPASSASHGGSLLAFPRIGQVTATLGEVRNRADLLVFWGVDPDTVHPGFMARYAAPAPDAPPRTVLAVDVGAARAPADIAERIEVPAEREVEVLWALRARIRGRRIDAPHGAADGWPDVRLRELAARLLGCRYGVILHDAEPPAERRDPMRAMALAALVADANRRTRLRLIGVRPPGNGAGAEAVLGWQTGFPFAVHFGRGYPRHGPGEFTAEGVLARGEADAALLVGADPPRELSPAAAAHLERIPSVVVGDGDAWVGAGTRVHLVTPRFEELPGTVYRMDGVALR